MSYNSCEFYINNSTNNSSLCYNASSVFYVSLDVMRNIFQFSSSDVSSNGLDISAIDNSNSDISYYCDSFLYPNMNIAHSMMFGEHSINSMIDLSDSHNLLKHDLIRYLADKLFGSYKLSNLIHNRKQIIDSIEVRGWNFISTNQTILDFNYNDGIGLNNTDISYNICRNIMKTIATFSPSRFDLTNGETTYSITNTTNKQSVPFVEGDTLNYIITINPPLTQEQLTGLNTTINPRTYRIQLYLTNNSNYTNVNPHDSIADISNNSYGITNYGVPT
jgi:hypothetical protein